MLQFVVLIGSYGPVELTFGTSTSRFLPIIVSFTPFLRLENIYRKQQAASVKSVPKLKF